MIQTLRQKPLIFLFCLLFAFSSCTSARQGSSEPNIEAWAEEVALGEKIHSEILSNFHVYTEPQVVGYVERIGQSIAQHAKRQEWDYQFTLLYNEKIYATSAPGGFVYVTTGMINFLENESELAAVIAHEIAEIQHKDPRLSKMRKALATVMKGGQMVAPAFGQLGAFAILGLALVNVVVDVKEPSPEGRVKKADDLGMQYMVKAGYDPQGMIDVMYRFLNAEKIMLPYFYDYYEKRPITEKRFKAVEKSFSELPLEDKTFTTNREIYQEHTKGIREIYRT